MRMTNQQLKDLILSETRRVIVEAKGKKARSPIDTFQKYVADEIPAALDAVGNEDDFVAEIEYEIQKIIEEMDEEDVYKIVEKLDSNQELVAKKIVDLLFANKAYREVITHHVNIALSSAAKTARDYFNFTDPSGPEVKFSRAELQTISSDLSDYLGFKVSPNHMDVVQDPKYSTVFAIKIDTGDTYLYNMESGTFTEKKFKSWPPKVKKSR